MSEAHGMSDAAAVTGVTEAAGMSGVSDAAGERRNRRKNPLRDRFQALHTRKGTNGLFVMRTGVE